MRAPSDFATTTAAFSAAVATFLLASRSSAAAAASFYQDAVPEKCDPWIDRNCELTERPVIGILSQLSDPHNASANDETYIAASYVKWVESGGGRAVPVMVNQTAAYYSDLLSKLNGFLIPGGDQNMTAGPFSDAVKHIYNATLEMNRNGIYFPLWGTCLGFEFITIAHNNGKNWLSHCEAANMSLALEFTNGVVDQSRLFSNTPLDVFDDLVSKNVTINAHHYCLTVTNFTKSKMNKAYRLLSTSTDITGERFISSFEHRLFPIYGVIFHPEKANFEPNWRYNFNHGPEATRASQYFAWFFVNEARKNTNKFESQAVEDNALIYNYNATFTGKSGGYFEQEYQFPQ